MRALVTLTVLWMAACDGYVDLDEHAYTDRRPWHEIVDASVDHQTLQAALEDLLPPRSGVLALRVLPPSTTYGAPRYRFYSAHGRLIQDGRSAIFDTDFFPASTAKLIASIVAFEYAHRQGYDSDDVPTHCWEARTAASKSLDTLAMEALTYCEGACNNAANPAFDRLVAFAGLDYVPRELLTTDRGFYRERDGAWIPGALQSRLGSFRALRDEVFQIWDAHSPVTNALCSGAAEDDCEILRADCAGEDPVDCADGDAFEYVDNCPFGPGNCVSLFDLSEAMRRVVLGDELPRSLRLRMLERDRERLSRHLMADRYPYANEGAAAAGAAPQVWHKFGSGPKACVETMFVQYSPEERYGVALWTDRGAFGECAQLIRTVVEQSIVTLRDDQSAIIVHHPSRMSTRRPPRPR